jgi:hypothetical protein
MRFQAQGRVVGCLLVEGIRVREVPSRHERIKENANQRRQVQMSASGQVQKEMRGEQE